MIKLLKIEWNKLWPSKTFRILFGIYASVFILFLLVVIKIEGLKDLNNIASSIYNPFQFPDVFIIISILAQLLTLLPAIIVIVLVTNEFTYRTARQHVIDGLSRFEFVLLKFIDVKTLTLLSTLLVFIFSLIIGGVSDQSDMGATLFQSLLFLVAFFFKTLGFLTVAMFLAILIKRTGITILLFIVVHLGLIDNLVKSYLNDDLGRYMPISVFNRSISLNDGIFETLGNLFNGKGFANGAIDIVHVAPFGHFVLMTVYIAGLLGLSYLALKSRDLKS